MRFWGWVLLAGMQTLAWAAGPEEGVSAFQKQDYTTAMTVLAPLAQQGDALSQYYVASMQLNGWGTTRDIETGMITMRQSAAAGDPNAQNFLAKLATLKNNSACQEQALGGHHAKLCLIDPGQVQHYQFSLEVDGYHVFTLLDDYSEQVSLTHTPAAPGTATMELALSRQGGKTVTVSGGCKQLNEGPQQLSVGYLCNFNWGKVPLIRDMRFSEE